MIKEEDITCSNCESEFFIQYDDNTSLEYCPFCKHPLDRAYIEEEADYSYE